MHRHHPYGNASYDERRRSMSPVPRYSRSDRGGYSSGYRGGSRGGGRGRGRGSHSTGSYDSGPPVSTYDYENNGYNGSDRYGSTPSTFGSYGGPPPPGPGSYSAPAPYSNSHYDDDWHEDRSRGPPPPRRREREDKVHDAIIEERINRERPCRTLFVRNIKYESDSSAIRRQFEEHGQIRTFFDLIHTRGMVFVTYYDLRAAQAARAAMQGREVSGRPIDVHYSLPRGDERQQRCDREKAQGTLLVTLRNSNQVIDENEVRRKFQQFGDVKAVRIVPGRSEYVWTSPFLKSSNSSFPSTSQRLVELYDTRATEQAFDAMRHQGLQDGVMDLEWAWDVLDDPVVEQPAPPPRSTGSYRGSEDSYNRDRPSRGPPRGRGGRGGGPSGRDDDYYDRRDRDPYPSGESSWDDDRPYGGRGGGRGRGGPPSGSSRGGYGQDRYESRDTYDRSYTAPPPPAPATQVDDRLEQARKVQQLLAALKNPQDLGAPAPPAAPTTPQAANRAPAASFGSPNGPAYNGAYHPPPSATQPWSGGPYASAGTNASPAGLPPAVLALLQQTTPAASTGSIPSLESRGSYYPGQQHLTVPHHHPYLVQSHPLLQLHLQERLRPKTHRPCNSSWHFLLPSKNDEVYSLSLCDTLLIQATNWRLRAIIFEFCGLSKLLDCDCVFIGWLVISVLAKRV
ncbi:uncharacterized protein EI90DRAFT_637413 [Cantharellus anzutake]|uniref:uncharacterized protein n=1 Tax=Cantharellus anzutake TaxID=1750568 RepID=UPI001906D8EC|nr:uncharacterized protein EI90DRAFT_637413 [Cantharellus anzutake]KAF8333168.1 hypothetical protein EI90DRAFT_637413 [Cantharellus anzutake]